MGVVRHLVLPVARLLVWTVIAAALCWIAFRPDTTGTASSDGGLVPTAELSTEVVPAALGDIASTIDVTGTVSADAATTTKATAAGAVSRVRVAVGDAVAADTPVADVLVTLAPVEQPVVTAPDGTTSQAPPKERTKTVTITAGAAGTVATVAVLKDQEVAVGADVATVSPGTLTVTAPLTQAQQFQLLAPPASASAQAPGGPAPFECGQLRTGATPAAEGDTTPQIDPYTGVPAEASTAQVSCAVPPGTTVFAGMSVDLSIDLGSATGVVVLPVTAVLGTIGDGTVWVQGPPAADGTAPEPEERAVKLGLSDGSQVQITEGLAEGDEVLLYTPLPSDDPAAASTDGTVVMG